MGSVDLTFAKDLRDQAGIRRAVETGTFRGITARGLAGVFDEVVTIELSAELHASASEALSDVPNVRALQGHSVSRLTEVADASVPTLYFLDGHWSGGNTEGADDECPVLEELAAIGSGHTDDAFIIDDARLFTSAPAPPHKPEQWPTLIEVFDALRALHPHHVVTLLDDQVVAAPQRAKAAVDAHGQRVQRVSPIVARARSFGDVVRQKLGG
jgi:hypothetical protein